MPFPDRLIPKLGTLPDTVLAREAGVTSVAVMKQRQKRGIPAFTGTAKQPPPPPDDEDDELDTGAPAPDASLGRKAFIEGLLTKALADLSPWMPGYSSTLKAVSAFHAELERIRDAERPPAEKLSPADRVLEFQREAPTWPDQLLEVVVGVYLDRHGYVIVPKALRAV